MIRQAARSPGLGFASQVRHSGDPSPLRSDVAGFLGRTRRGPVGVWVRVEGWRSYLRVFGGLTDAFTPYAIRGYFENGGQVAYVLRLCGPVRDVAAEEVVLGALGPDLVWDHDGPAAGGFAAARYRVEAATPGEWADGTEVTLEYHRDGIAGRPQVDVGVAPPGEAAERFVALEPRTFHEAVNQRSAFVRIRPSGPAPAPAPPGAPGPRRGSWAVTLSGGGTSTPGMADYRAAIVAGGAERRRALADEPEIAIIAAPDLCADLSGEDERDEIWATLLEEADRTHDRLVLVDLPPDPADPDQDLGAREAIARLEQLRQRVDATFTRAGALYYPRLCVPDPLGGITRPLKVIPPSGHVAGVMSRLDRERGPHHTPANAAVLEAVDLSRAPGDEERATLNAAGINPVRAVPGRGLQVWGGRTIARDAAGRFVGPRRLIHRLVRAIRRVAEPLAFDVNGPELWLAFTRAVTTVLLEAFRAGALKGARPEEAFRVQCDDQNNPPEAREAGQCLCFIEIAPAAPMEFILLRVALSTDGSLEVTA